MHPARETDSQARFYVTRLKCLSFSVPARAGSGIVNFSSQRPISVTPFPALVASFSREDGRAARAVGWKRGSAPVVLEHPGLVNY